ncbi:Glyoxalase/Bleomycin resistance protein/Dioxygenase superfamily protein [Catalinimonas alkaloidigena]|uniref:Glyoxalase/Bleomycin resistance protein/Dioxygenase superfamily protein n=1 Tax=Catalinimonas alkaloidigena TaxID=1075417 RepID=A0A1G9PG53_9BACT|nr:VOC family protein [Catalinimonas alkaloidigena]SDL97704.1 Glyoxalase/Bleomycin resistance protein/Dioxygenase superfamily protein [Catalinimonas alkaloidigena]
MKLEHFALNVQHPQHMADWYVTHLGLTIVKQSPEAPFMTFLADDSGRIMIEIYTNPADEVPDYAHMNPLLVHLAFVSADPDVDKNRLIEAGATLVSDQTYPDGSHLVMLRDPWGLALQLCKRGTPMLTERERS